MISRSLLKLIEEIGNPASIIDQTLLRPEAGPKRYERFVEESERYGFRSLVVPLSRVSLVSSITKKPVAAVIGFPHGNTELEIKLREIEIASSRGAREVDVVLDIGSIVEGLWDRVEAEIKAISTRAKELGLISKVIIETGYLTRDQIERVSRIAANYEIDYVKTSTGFGPRGASVDDVILIKQSLAGKKTGVKAAGGIRTIWDLAILVAAGADIIGSSSGIEIVNQYETILKQKSPI
ncbi:MAG: deoxyribose-phosphate aldolase [Sulfolobales archaeon]